MYSSVALITFQMPNSQMWLMTTAQQTTHRNRAFLPMTVDSCPLDRTSVQLRKLGHILKILKRF